MKVWIVEFDTHEAIVVGDYTEGEVLDHVIIGGEEEVRKVYEVTEPTVIYRDLNPDELTDYARI